MTARWVWSETGLLFRVVQCWQNSFYPSTNLTTVQSHGPMEIPPTVFHSLKFFTQASRVARSSKSLVQTNDFWWPSSKSWLFLFILYKSITLHQKTWDKLSPDLQSSVSMEFPILLMCSANSSLFHLPRIQFSLLGSPWLVPCWWGFYKPSFECKCGNHGARFTFFSDLHGWKRYFPVSGTLCWCSFTVQGQMLSHT